MTTKRIAKRSYFKIFILVFFLTLELNIMSASETLAAPVPVTSYRLDITDDTENNYSGAPEFDWDFFAGRMRIWPRFAHAMPAHRDILEQTYDAYMLSLRDFNTPVSNIWVQGAVTGEPYEQGNVTTRPPVPLIVYSDIGKPIYPPGTDEQPHSYNINDILDFTNFYTNTIYGGGRISEADDMIGWTYEYYYNKFPVGPGNHIFPAVYQDSLEANMKRGDVPFMYYQQNSQWAPQYTAKARINHLLGSQTMNRSAHVLATKLAKVRSAARQYPHLYGVQYSGQVNLIVGNPDDVINNGADPIWLHPDDNNYQKSYALNRQMLYLNWLNGACFFQYETGLTYRYNGWYYIPTPLGEFTNKADKFINSFGPTGPVQTPIAIVSEFNHVWNKPDVAPWNTVQFNCMDGPYVMGDYQEHAITDFFYPHYLQCGWVYESTKGEDYSITPTPYGNSIDFMLSDVRPEALKRYGLLVWSGVPPQAPGMVRDKMLNFINDNNGRVVLFGSAAKAMFPELFVQGGTQYINSGSQVTYNGQTFTESADFMLEELQSTTGMNILATVNEQPLIVESQEGLIIVLSEYGLNYTEYVDPDNATWTDGQIITEIPHKLLEHARRLLDDEANKQMLFDVGNDDLHYIVTRPITGEYVLGLFNHKLTSEPFSITSHIGTIQSLEEVTLNDGQDQLKSVVNGAAYVPAGLRNSPDLPLDFGLSDSSNIEGKDFRLFRIQVDESGTGEINQFTFPSRPEGRVLSVSGLAFIRRYIQGVPSFFQWFDGVKVSADYMLDMDTIWLNEVKFWLDRRGVRVVVDGQGIAESEAITIINKLGMLEKAPKDLIINSPSSTVVSLASANGVRLVASANVNYLDSMGDMFSDTSTLNVMNRFYVSEEDIYIDYSHFENGEVISSLHGYRSPSSLIGHLDITGDKSDSYIYAGIHVNDLKALIEYDAYEFSKFKGIKIDSTYLLSKTPEALAEDAAVLQKYNLDVIVDLRRDEYHLDRITFYPHFAHYDKGISMYEDIVDKMPIIGAENLIVGVTDMHEETQHIEERDQAWGDFADYALQYNIDLHLITETADAPVTEYADLSQSNVFVINGLTGGTNSPYTLINSDGSQEGTGTTIIYDADRGLYCDAELPSLGIEEETPCGGKIPFTDLNGDGNVYFDDLQLLSAEWLEFGEGKLGDINGDCSIDLVDLSFMAQDWITSVNVPTEGILNGNFNSPDVDPYYVVVPDYWDFSGAGGNLGVQNGGVESGGQFMYYNGPDGKLSQRLNGVAVNNKDYEMSFYAKSANTGTYQVTAKILFDDEVVASATITSESSDWQQHSISYHSNGSDVYNDIKVEFEFSTIESPVQAQLDEVEFNVN